MVTNDTTLDQSLRTPIILIPGLCSTKLNIVHNETGAKERAWVSAHYIPKSRMGEKMINDVWGKPTADGKYKSFIEDIGSMQVIEGFDGCSHLARHWGISMIHAFNPKFMLGRYFTTLKNRLKKRGYRVNEDLFCHAYDWRQPLSSDAVLGSLRRLIMNVQEKTGFKQVILIGHSHGALLVRLYMQEYDDWYQHIHRFIALGPPYDNSSSYMAMSLINGFALKIPFIKQITARNFQASSSVPVFLGPAPVMPQLEEYGVGQYIPTCIFLKKVNNNSVDFSRSVGISTCDPGPIYCTDNVVYKKFFKALKSSDLSLRNIHVDLTKYGKKFPDLSSLLLIRLSRNPELILPKYEEQTLRLLLANIKRGALRSKTTGSRIWSSNLLYVDTLLTPRYTIGVPTREAIENKLGLWKWEAYTSWVESSESRVPYVLSRALKHPWFHVDGNKLLLKEDAPHRDEIQGCRIGGPTEIVRWSSRPDLLQHAYANSIYSSFRDFTALRDIFEEDGKLERLSSFSTKEKDAFVPLDMCNYKAAVSDLRYKKRITANSNASSNKAPSSNTTIMQPVKQTKTISSDKQYDEQNSQDVEIITASDTLEDTCTLELVLSLHSARQLKSLRSWRNSGIVRKCVQIPPTPWSSLDFVTTTTYLSVLSLMKNLNRPGSLENYLFEPFAPYWDNIYKVRTRPIRFPKPEETSFRYFAICGSGCRTPLHVVYNQPVGSYHELCTQIPTTIDSDGDGTVLLHSALSDGFPQELVIDRVVVKNLTHFMLIHDASVWNLLEEALFSTS